jgi:hypothetical protein
VQSFPRERDGRAACISFDSVDLAAIALAVKLGCDARNFAAVRALKTTALLCLVACATAIL